MAKKKKQAKNKEQNHYGLIISCLVVMALCIIGVLNYGAFGEVVSSSMKYMCGYMYYVLYFLIFVTCIILIKDKNLKKVKFRYKVGIIFLFFACTMLLTMIITFPYTTDMKGLESLGYYINNSISYFNDSLPNGGGLIGASLYAGSTYLFDRVGTYIIIALLVLIGMLFIISVEIRRRMGGYVVDTGANITQSVIDTHDKWKEDRSIKKQIKMEEKQLVEQTKLQMIDYDDSPEPSFIDKAKVEPLPEINKKSSLFIDVNQVRDGEEDVLKQQKEEILPAYEEPIVEDIIEDTVVTPSKEETVTPVIKEEKSKFDYTNYRLPPLRLLKNTSSRKSSANSNNASTKGQQLIDVLDSFGVHVSLVDTHIGPSVTKFEIRPENGVSVKKISNLQQDLKMGLAAKDIRIEAPIPGKSTVGIEIPNQEKTMVGMRDLMKNIPLEKSDKKLLFALGKDLTGDCVYGELNKMPHLLIAGATGSGKSVCVNSIITSILMRTKPDEVKMLLVDPKKVEFTMYQNIPHLICPVVTDASEANNALKLIVEEMDERYDTFSKCGVRNISGYNTYLNEHPEEPMKKLPYIMVVIDELADLMLVAAKEVESSIQRITQLARAAGIHLIVATQRPSVDVITGVIKANIPSRIAFAVSSITDSRTILDQGGAEKLLGNGDMLYIPVGDQVTTRVQGCFVSDEEVEAICTYCSDQASPKYDDRFMNMQTDASANKDGTNQKSSDPLYEEAKQLVIETRQASTSFLQRKFSIGYSRAARLMDALQIDGVIGPARGSKPREVLQYPEEE